MGFPLYFICFFSLTAFNILSLFSVLVVLMIICCGEVLFWSSLFGVLVDSCTWMGKTFLRFGKLFVIILLNVLHIPLTYTSSPSMPMILRFGFWWSCWVLAYSFHSSWVVWLIFLLFFSSISILSSSSEILSSTFSALVEMAFHCVFCLTKGTFYFHNFCLILFFWGFPYLCSTPL
jgi:hypothetical protein